MKRAKFSAAVVGKAHHARQMDAETRWSWKKELSRRRSKSIDAPSWLWSSVVALVASHETAYLEHCRKLSSSAEANPRQPYVTHGPKEGAPLTRNERVRRPAFPLGLRGQAILPTCLS